MSNTKSECDGGELSSPDNNSPWKSYKPEELSGRARYGLSISSVVPRPVGVLSTISPDGMINCAPYSFTSLAGFDPPTVTHGICMKSAGQKKDTLANIEATGEWVFNVLSKEITAQINQCSESLPSDVDEMEKFNLEKLPCDIVKPPRVANAKVAMECKLISTTKIFNDSGDHTTTIVIGKVVNFHVHETVLKDGQEENDPRVDLHKLQPVGRAGDITYW
eukprot:CAMPEP_0184870142 /NCGR_PEP_ID=MMETSP0580-20130426/36607_1 /TAXON_ID=1118495 /ORGANISM="Dactyliosolen fragilissimus" /LENGTH=219 /DNA_ID=CAMNT_0027372085 /DNA_START=166 /DNA_END=822 /DNA_ORIENTATION=+